jgi:hypothetical protein
VSAEKLAQATEYEKLSPTEKILADYKAEHLALLEKFSDFKEELVQLEAKRVEEESILTKLQQKKISLDE